MSTQPRIPKRFIQTWKSSRLPGRYRRFQRALRRHHPDYELLLFTDDEMRAFMREEYPEYLDAFERIPDVVGQTDLFRLLAVHKLGGFYADLDVLFVKPVDELREHACVFPFQSNTDSYFAAMFGSIDTLGQYAFGAEAGHPFLIACAESIAAAVTRPGWSLAPSDEVLATLFTPLEPNYALAVYYTTGPSVITRTFIEQPGTRRDVRIISPYDARNNRKLYYCFGVYGVHGMHGTWKGDQAWYVPWLRRLGTGVAMSLLLNQLKIATSRVDSELPRLPARPGPGQSGAGRSGSEDSDSGVGRPAEDGRPPSDWIPRAAPEDDPAYGKTMSRVSPTVSSTNVSPQRFKASDA